MSDSRSAYEDVRDAITTLENMRVSCVEPTRPDELSDIEQRRITALGYLESAVVKVYVADVRAAAAAYASGYAAAQATALSRLAATGSSDSELARLRAVESSIRNDAEYIAVLERHVLENAGILPPRAAERRETRA